MHGQQNIYKKKQMMTVNHIWKFKYTRNELQRYTELGCELYI